MASFMIVEMASFMMPIAPGLIDALREYGEESEKNKAKLIASFMIGHSGSSTMNMTNAEWVSSLRMALKQINLRYRGSGGTSYGRIL
jgi:hypothetical protein